MPGIMSCQERTSINKPIATDPFYSCWGVIISTEVENPGARMLIRRAFLFAHSFTRIQVGRGRAVPRCYNAEAVSTVKEVLETCRNNTRLLRAMKNIVFNKLVYRGVDGVLAI